jgi:uncharacterized protein YecE (DUF72 family)
MEAPPSTKDGLSETALSRRTFLRSSLTASAGLTGILLTQTPPAFAQERELKLLTFAHFVPASDDELRRQLEEFGKQAGVKVRMDQVAHLQLPAVLASEVQGQKGHDIIGLSRFAMPNLYAKQLVKLDDLAEKIGRDALTTLIVVTHSDEVARAASRRIEMRDGQIVGDSVSQS